MSRVNIRSSFRFRATVTFKPSLRLGLGLGPVLSLDLGLDLC